MSQHGGYDQALLDEAPVATRAQRQEGYNVDLLDTRPSRPLSTQPLPPPPQPITYRDTDVESSPQEKFAPAAVMYAQKPTQSFWRTRNGKITILVIIVLVLGAVIGGAVGGVVGKKSSNGNSNPPPSSSTSGTPTTSSTSIPTASSTGTPPSVASVTSASSGDGANGNPSQANPGTPRGTSTSSTSTSSSVLPMSSGSSTATIPVANLAEDS